MEVGGGLQDVLRGGLLCFLPFSTHLPCLPHLPFQRLKPEERGEVTFQPLIFFPPSFYKLPWPEGKTGVLFTWDHISSFSKRGLLFSFLWSHECEIVGQNTIYRNKDEKLH